MKAEYLEWGSTPSEQETEEMPEPLRALADFCSEHSACEVLYYTKHAFPLRHSVVIDIGDGTFEQDNVAGILRSERISLSYQPYGTLTWEVRALRKDFPITIHQNQVALGEPRSLCLYLENWKVVERSWTPESFIERVLWWLRLTAEGNIHADDQPIEQLFFNSPVIIQLPKDFNDRSTDPDYRLAFNGIQPTGSNKLTLLGEYARVVNTDKPKVTGCISISIQVPPIENGPVENYPSNLGGLQSWLINKGGSILEPLKSEIIKYAGKTGLSEAESSKATHLLVILTIPRSRDGKIEKKEQIGFIIKAGLGELGESIGALHKSKTGDNKWYENITIGGASTSPAPLKGWEKTPLDLARVKKFPSDAEIREYSGLDPNDIGPKGIIAGVGSLGSLLANLWRREAWGEWFYVDDDIVETHNLARHVVDYLAIGAAKIDAIRYTTDGIYEKVTKINSVDYLGSITDDNSELSELLSTSEILVDVTTTLYAPRDLAERDDVPRVASVFFTPSGSASVMLLDDEHRSIRGNHLEAQYYRAILRSDWGSTHLDGNQRQYWVGAGCRDITTSLSYEMVQLHGATLARQLRKAVASPHARISIWEHDDDTGAIKCHNVPVTPSRSEKVAEWTINWDLEFEGSILIERQAQLPNETGGMLLGIVDHKTKSITLVDWTCQPEDSIATLTSFSRGTLGQMELVHECQKRTAGIVDYVGEWHSHPSGHTAKPSINDTTQLTLISSEFSLSGTHPIMMIIAEDSIGLCIEGDVAIIDLSKKN